MKNLARSILILLTLVYFVSPFVPIDTNIVLFVFGIAILLMALVMGKKARYTISGFLIASILILVILSKPFDIFISGTSYLLYIASILVIMKLLSIPIQLGNYENTIESLLQKYFGKDKHLFLFTTILSHLLAVFLHFGTIPITLSLMGDTLRKRIKNFHRFFSTTVGRGYAFMTIWSPCGIMVLIVLKVVGIEWSQLLLPGLMLCTVGIISSYLVESRSFTAGKEVTSGINNSLLENGDSPDVRVQEQNTSGSIFDIILVVIGMVVFIYLLEKFTELPTYSCVMLSGLIIFGCWMLKFAKNKALKSNLKTYWQGIDKDVELIALFVVFGIFAKVVESIGLADSLFKNLQIEQFGFLIIVIIPLIIMLLSLFGVNPTISVVIVGQLIAPATIFFSKTAIALTLLFGSSLSFMLSPFAGVVLTLSNYLDRRPSEITLKWNRKFVLIFFLEGLLFIYLLMTVGLI